MSIPRIHRPLHNFFQKALLSRAYATTSTYVPPAQLIDIQDSFDPRKPEKREADRTKKTRPPELSFYTTRSVYHEELTQLETAIKSSRKVLTTLQLLPLPEFARGYIPPANPAWKDKSTLSSELGSAITSTRYRKIVILLTELDYYRRIAATAEAQELSDTIGNLLSHFESGTARAQLELKIKQQLKRQILDQYGRSYTVGRRKTSSARVWIIPTKKESVPANTVVPSEAQVPPPATDAEALESMFGKQDATAPVSQVDEGTPQAAVTPTTVLVNNIPLAEYFPIPADREKIIRPIKLAGVLGGYHVFTLVRGGGTTGQSGAIAHGIAKGIAIHEPSMESVLRDAKLLRRDPRMVERKKTGLAKARKRYAWVKR